MRVLQMESKKEQEQELTRQEIIAVEQLRLLHRIDSSLYFLVAAFAFSATYLILRKD